MSEPHGLGRVPSPPDPRDAKYLARSQFMGAAVPPQRMIRRWYSDNLRIDQGPIGQCTMASAAHLIAAGPVTQRPYTYKGMGPPFDTVAAYCVAQAHDRRAYGWSHPTYCQDRIRGDNGATMRGAGQALRELGFISHFWWLRDVGEVLSYLTNAGPVWLGTWWYQGMSRPDAEGFARPTGRKQGGHAYLLDAVTHRGEYVWLLNSWGARWGKNGRAKLAFRDLEALLADDGEALAVTEVRKAA